MGDQDTEGPRHHGPAYQKKRTCILILGMHRSGTSALTRVLNIAGAKLPNRLMAAGSGNELGHWEPAQLAAYHDELLQELNSHWNDWQKLDLNILALARRRDIKREIIKHLESDYGNDDLIVLKEPRICRFAPFFIETLKDAGYDVRVIIPVRNPLEIAESLRKRGDFGSSKTIFCRSSLLWLRHVLDAEAATRNLPRSIISYDSLLSDWSDTLKLLSAQLNVKWPNSPAEIATGVQSFLASERRHHSYSNEDLNGHPEAQVWVTQTYEAILSLQHDPHCQNSLHILDRVRHNFDDAEPLLRGMGGEDDFAKELAISSYKAKARDYENAIAELRSVLDELQQKVDRRKKRRRELRAILSNPAKYLLERNSSKTTRH